MNKKLYKKPSTKMVELENEVLMLDGSNKDPEPKKNPDLEEIPIDNNPWRYPWD